MVGSGLRRSDDSQTSRHSNQETVFLIVPQSGVRSLRRMVYSVGLVLFETPEAARFSSENGKKNTTDHAGFDVVWSS